MGRISTNQSKTGGGGGGGESVLIHFQYLAITDRHVELGYASWLKKILTWHPSNLNLFWFDYFRNQVETKAQDKDEKLKNTTQNIDFQENSRPKQEIQQTKPLRITFISRQKARN